MQLRTNSKLDYLFGFEYYFSNSTMHWFLDFNSLSLLHFRLTENTTQSKKENLSELKQSGKLLVGQNKSWGNIFVGETFSHQAKI